MITIYYVAAIFKECTFLILGICSPKLELSSELLLQSCTNRNNDQNTQQVIVYTLEITIAVYIRTTFNLGISHGHTDVIVSDLHIIIIRISQ